MEVNPFSQQLRTKQVSRNSPENSLSAKRSFDTLPIKSLQKYPVSPRDLGIDKVTQLVKQEKQTHPLPNAYFIRRSPVHLKQYLNQKEEISKMYNSRTINMGISQNYNHFPVCNKDRLLLKLKKPEILYSKREPFYKQLQYKPKVEKVKNTD